jgi:NAD(P)-dependent dehydrogenase (short-subunit alcohol dehydrogenase family)
MPEFSAYSASKHALVGLMRSAAAECAPRGLRINCINPATTGTRKHVQAPKMPQVLEAPIK